MAAVTGSIGANGATVQINAEAANAVGVNLLSSAFIGTLAFQGSTDGNNWFAIGAYPVLASGLLGPVQITTTAAGAFSIATLGLQYVRVTSTAFTSGLMSVGLDAASSAPVGVVGVNTDGQKATYSACVNAHAPAATPTDWFTIQGSATKTIRLTRIRVRARATAANQYRVSLIKYSVFLTGGTPAAVTAIPHDSNDAAATAAVQTWSAGLPTVGTPVGKIEDDSIPMAVLGTPVFAWADFYDAGARNARAVVLRGTAQYVALNSAAVALPAGSVFDVKAEWTEE